jgi:preprotein translocase subunit SecF
MFRGLWILGLFWVVLATGLLVLAATVFNLIADLVGGVRVTVLEEEVVVRQIETDGP